ncbi:MAG TPA: helix-turn-helix domain-containing protein [Ktedonobacterales bacterium]
MPAEQTEERRDKVLPEDLFIISDLETLKVVTDPLRLNIVNLLRGGPRTTKELAKALHLSQTKLYYHIGLLEQHGLVRVVGTRLVSGILEKQYQATAYKLSVDRRLFSPAPTSAGYEGLEVFLSAVLDYTHSDMMRSVRSGLAHFSDDAPPERKLNVGRRWFWLTAEEARAYLERLEALDDEFQRLHDDAPPEGAQLYEFLMGFYPTHERAPDAAPQQMGIEKPGAQRP